ncbi:hypothetical protein [Comamonas sp. NLF-1-9]|uniref:hypothetical protein n=1 Tax=Comamonas sp. NLF-1-9 TaxID=2853163 RepID=UPI001C4523A5|nr:hypothetical protein [Comamonas sp. NLF-1-9]QXL85242.1 hypothetical protein KUD94_04510 [Comamonas sp. NLF-1-9]
MFEPKLLVDEIQWIPVHQRRSHFGGPMPPRKPDVRLPALWLRRSGSELYLVNHSAETLHEVYASSTGFVTLDDTTSSWASQGVCYRDVPHNAAVKVDEYDDFYDLDYVLGMHIRLRSPSHPGLQLECIGDKGGIEEAVLLWCNGEVGKDARASCLPPATGETERDPQPGEG